MFHPLAPLPRYARIACASVTLLLAPMAVQAQTWAGAFAGSNESPPNLSVATGTAVVSLSGTSLSAFITFNNLIAPATAAHIHCCAAPGANAPVVVILINFPSATSGTLSNAFDLSNPAFLATLLNGLNAGQAYVNIHNQTFPGGEIRANLTLVPEPSTYALVAAGLAALGVAARRRRRA